MGRLFAALAIIVVLGHAAPDSTLREPAYATARPGYAVVEFGAKAERRVWLVADGKTLIVDRNANGDLTETGERIEADDRGTFVTEVLACGADGRQKPYRLRATLEVDAEGARAIKTLSVNPVEDIQQFHCNAALVPLADRPADAPVFPIDGPLRFALMDHWTGSTACRVLPREGGEHEFSLLVATPVRGSRTEACVYPNLYPLHGEELPTVRVEFESASGTSAPPVRTWQCECARRYRFKVVVPAAATTTRARVFVSFPRWKHGELPAAEFELEYAKVSEVPGRAAPAKDRSSAPR